MDLMLVAGESLPWNYKVQTLLALLKEANGDDESAEHHSEAGSVIWEQMTKQQRDECNEWVRREIPPNLL